MRKIMASLDVGSESVKLVVGEIVKKKLNILAIAESEALGVRNGLIEDANSILEPLENVIQKCEEVIGLKIRQMIVSVPAIDADFQVVTGSVKIINEGNLIDGTDVIRVLQKAAKSAKLNNDMEYISLIPTSFSLDDARIVKDPKGLTSKVLSVRGVLVSTPKKNIYPILTALEKLNIDVLDISMSSIGDYFEYKNKEKDKNVGVVINVGDQTTTVSVFNKGVLTNSSVTLVGGQNIDNDISFIYKVPINTARELKEKFALSTKVNADASETIETTDKFDKKVVINQQEISEVVESRLQEIFNMAKKEINHLTKKEISYIMITGGVTECRDIRLILESIFGDNFQLGEIKEIGARNNKYSVCLGLLKYYAETAKLKDKDYSIFSIEEQQKLSGAGLSSEDESVIGKLFGYIFNG